jgi:hypothetical protein
MLLLVSGAGVQSWSQLYARESGFWNKKDPSQWSAEEVDRLATDSPWAKEVTASTPGYNPNPGGMGRGPGMGGPGLGGGGMGGPGMGGPGMGGGRIGGMEIPDMGGGGMGGGRRHGGRGGGLPMQFKGVVRWISAKPVVEGLKIRLPENLASDYVISVSGIPILANGRQRTEDGDNQTAVSKAPSPEVLDRVKDLTYLEPKGKAPAQPGVVQAAAGRPGETTTLWFGFSRELLQLTPSDKEVTFTTQLGRVQVKTKFNLKDMMYHKELAL